MKTLALLTLALTLATACSPSCPPVESGKPRAVGCPAPPLPPGTPTCMSACARVGPTEQGGLGCELGKPTPNGGTCEAVCENVQINNAGVGFNVACITRAETCAAADACR